MFSILRFTGNIIKSNAKNNSLLRLQYLNLSTFGKVINCKAAVLWKEGQQLSIEKISVDPPKKGEVRVKLVAAGICATDAHFVWGWNTDLALNLEGNPLVLGHEGAGIVESVGEDVKSVKEGDKVMLMWLPECGHCPQCENPKTNSCVSGNFATTLYLENRETRLSVNGKPLLSFGGTAAFSEFAVLRESQVAKINSKADLSTVCIIGCAVGTGYGSATNIAKVHPNSVCAIWGLGAIGLSAVLGCKAMNAKTVIGVDLNPQKEKIALKMGCTHFVTSLEALEEVVKSEGQLDYAFDCVGNQTVLNSAIKLLSLWGTLTVVGLAPRGSKVEVTVDELLSGKHVCGGYFGNEKPRALNQTLVEKELNGKLDISPLITNRKSLDQINEAFDDLKNGKTIRTVIEF